MAACLARRWVLRSERVSLGSGMMVVVSREWSGRAGGVRIRAWESGRVGWWGAAVGVAMAVVVVVVCGACTFFVRNSEAHHQVHSRNSG